MWLAAAACTNHPTPDIWFANSHSRQWYEAKRICSECPVNTECEADRHANEVGIRGGADYEEATAVERLARNLRRSLRRAAAKKAS